MLTYADASRTQVRGAARTGGMQLADDDDEEVSADRGSYFTTQFTCFTSTKGTSLLTPEALRARCRGVVSSIEVRFS
jgi:hypothetical protein